jgi:hypothetical protein
MSRRAPGSSVAPVIYIPARSSSELTTPMIHSFDSDSTDAPLGSGGRHMAFRRPPQRLPHVSAGAEPDNARTGVVEGWPPGRRAIGLRQTDDHRQRAFAIANSTSMQRYHEQPQRRSENL